MMRTSTRTLLLVLLPTAAVAVGLAYVAVDTDGPDYAGIRGCTLTSVVTTPAVEEVVTRLPALTLTPIADIERATVAIPWSDGRRALIASRDGTIYLVDPASGERTLVLDISERIQLNAEGGIVGAAVSPDHRHLYVHHTDLEGTSRILELATVPDGVDASSEREVLVQPHPALVHNGGAIAFGPDGYLYIGFGDGGGRPADAARVASMEHLDGKILRIDPFGASPDEPYGVPPSNPHLGDEGARQEIWLTGVRNPYRFAFDELTGDLWVGDVGEACYEEINLLPRGGAGADLGFPRFEGTHEFLGGNPVDEIFPVYTYSHEDGCAVIAGEVVRDPRLPSLEGRFLFSDYCSGGLHWLAHEGGRVTHGVVDVEVDGVQSFGLGPSREPYVLTARQVLQVSPAAG